MATTRGGNRRKLSTAIALVGDPAVVFLDEPTTGMDPGARRYLWDTLMRVVEDERSVVLTTHSMEEAEALCTRLAIMVDGGFRCIGSPQELKAKFGDGIQLTLRLSRVGRDSADDLEGLCNSIEATFQGAELLEAHGLMVTYRVPKQYSWGQVFTFVQQTSDIYTLEDTAVSQPSLEQIFLGIANDSSRSGPGGRRSSALHRRGRATDCVEEVVSITHSVGKTPPASPSPVSGGVANTSSDDIEKRMRVYESAAESTATYQPESFEAATIKQVKKTNKNWDRDRNKSVMAAGVGIKAALAAGPGSPAVARKVGLVKAVEHQSEYGYGTVHDESDGNPYGAGDPYGCDLLKVRDSAGIEGRSEGEISAAYNTQELDGMYPEQPPGPGRARPKSMLGEILQDWAGSAARDGIEDQAHTEGYKRKKRQDPPRYTIPPQFSPNNEANGSVATQW